MKYWMVSIPYQGIAAIAIEEKDDDKTPKMSDFRKHLQTQEVDLGTPIFKTQKPDIEEIDKDMFTRIKKFMKKKSMIDNLVNEIIKEASTLSGKQRESIIQFLESDPQMAFQEIANFLSKKINANESIIYSFLVSHDHSLSRDNDYLKRM